MLIIGAGAQGNVISGVLSKADDVSKIVLSDINLERVKEIAEMNKSDKIKVRRIDATNVNEMENFMKDEKFDLVVNATLPEFNRQIIQASYRAKINYIDMASAEIYPQKDIPIEQLEYNKEWKDAGLKALIGGGGDPGLSNIMA